jgi:hypothetical protein
MVKWILSCLLIGLLGANSFAQDTAKKGAKVDQETAMVNQFVKQLEPAGLSSEITNKIKELFGKTAKEVVAKRKDAKITPQMLKDRTDAAKKARDEGKKASEARELGLSAMNATEDQKKILLETEEMLSKTKVEIGKLLTEEQKDKLPKPLQANLKEPASKKK